MMINPFHVLFLSSLAIGSLVAVSSSSWFMAWVGLELNLLSFLPIIFDSGLMGSNESGIKYFFAQVLASLFLLFGSLFPLFLGALESNYLVLMALYFKIGAAPFHWWFISVINGMGWSACLLLLTWQKFAPLFLIGSFELIQLVALCSVLVGSVGGFNQKFLKVLLAYSSVMHIGWMISGVSLFLSLGMSYYLVYFFFSVVLVSLFSFLSTLSLEDLLVESLSLKSCLFLLMLSMGGFPPMLGFFPKWFVIIELLSDKIFLSFFLIFSSLVNLFFYFRLFYGGIFGKFVLLLGFMSELESLNWLKMGVVVSTLGGAVYPFLLI